MLLSTPHAHTTYVDGRSTAREMVEMAIAKGFVSFGLSEHAEDGIFGLSVEAEQAYRAEARALQAEYAGKIRMWVGMERDSIGIFDRKNYDYVLGSVHYVPHGDELVAVDGDTDRILCCIKEEYGGDPLRYAAKYFERLADYICAYRPQIIGHFDLPRKWNTKLGLFDTASLAYRRIAIAALERMADTGALLEVNSGAIARGYMDDVYPEQFELEHWRKLGGKAIVGSDCHLAKDLDTGFDKARARLLAAGYESVMLLGDKDKLFMECEI